MGALRGRGGRPKGSGNRVQMAPRPPGAADTPETGTAKFSLRSVKFTGVYRSRRSQEGWRAQFCYANKVRTLCWCWPCGVTMALHCCVKLWQAGEHCQSIGKAVNKPCASLMQALCQPYAAHTADLCCVPFDAAFLAGDQLGHICNRGGGRTCLE